MENVYRVQVLLAKRVRRRRHCPVLSAHSKFLPLRTSLLPVFSRLQNVLHYLKTFPLQYFRIPFSTLNENPRNIGGSFLGIFFIIQPQFHVVCKEKKATLNFSSSTDSSLSPKEAHSFGDSLKILSLLSVLPPTIAFFPNLFFPFCTHSFLSSNDQLLFYSLKLSILRVFIYRHSTYHFQKLKRCIVGDGCCRCR